MAFALQADDWYLRQDIIWAKPNPMPESVTDRCTKSHEYIFLLSKGPRYYFDAEAIERQLAHAPENEIRAIYNAAQYLDERRRMMNWWSEWLVGAAGFEPATS